MKTIAIFILAFCLNTVMLQNINAANYTRTGSTSTAWNNSGNWNPSGIPDSTDNVTIVSTTNQPILDQSGKVFYKEISTANQITEINLDLSSCPTDCIMAGFATGK